MRNNNIDALRLLAAFGIISLHLAAFPELTLGTIEIIRASFRWCVPFFLLLTGYFLSEPGDRFPRLTRQRIQRLVTLTVFASVIYLPLGLAHVGPVRLMQDVLFMGTWLHLWYLSGLVISLLLLEALRRAGAHRLAVWIGVAVALGYAVVSLTHAVTGSNYDTVLLMREFVGIPCILAGVAFRNIRPRGFAFHCLVLAGGAALLWLEMAALHALGGSYLPVQWSPSTILITLGLFGMALAAPFRAPDWLARWGSRDALGIYLYHPAMILLAGWLLTGQWALWPREAPGLQLWALSALLTAGLLRGLSLLPRLRALADGDLARAMTRPARPRPLPAGLQS